MEGEKKVGAMSRKGITVGPWGGHGGTSWDDGAHNGVREITLVYDRCIDSIKVEYDKYGKPALAEKHGGTGGTKTINIKMQHPEEFLTSVSGYYGPMVRGGSPVIKSLTFKTNKKTYGPFGVEEGTPFSFPIDGGFIVGFKGRSGLHLDAIGFHVSRQQASKLFNKVHLKVQQLLGQKNVDNTPHAQTNKINNKAHA